MSADGLPGGANLALTTVAQAFDLSVLAGRKCLFWCDEGQVEFSFTEKTSTSVALVTASQAASVTALVADKAGAGVKLPRTVRSKYSRLVARIASGTGTLRIKPIEEG